MVLRPNDFVAMEINWRDKAAKMIEISRQLDLAPSSFVFVDDSPQERELIRQALQFEPRSLTRATCVYPQRRPRKAACLSLCAY